VTTAPKQTSTDAAGKPVYDPTANVIALNEASVKRVDDLMAAESRRVADVLALTEKLNEERAVHLQDVAELREKHRIDRDALVSDYSAQLKRAEAGRIDSIRQVDREEVAKTAAANQLATAALDATTKQLAATLQQQVGTVAQAAEARQSTFATEVNKRLSALELSSSEGKGRQIVADPALAEAMSDMKRLLTLQATGSGKAAGVSGVWLAVVGAVGFLATLLSMGALIYSLTSTPTRVEGTTPTPVVTAPEHK
jgi:hypothetical protein